jgi:hypothetical protein
VQAYQRGLAYVEAGRLDDARGMLVLGERTYRPARLKADGEQEEGKKGDGREELAEVERLRAALMRALNVEEREQP